MRAPPRRVVWRWVLTAIGALLLGGLIWLFGPLLGPLEPVLPRAAILAAIALAWGLGNWLASHRSRRAEAALVEGIAEAEPDLLAADEEAAGVRERLSGALEMLRRAHGMRGYLYEQPWYAIIGPPGAGKTTALLNSGLEFPLEKETEEVVLRGVGGTRLCEWLLTEEAVLIDTAGRYVTQDSDAAVDRAGWEAFLDLLRRTRPRQPLNGIILAIALSDIAAAPQAERSAYARAVRGRVRELEERLGVRLPVYAILTKADLIAGFTEYFDDLGREQRAQVWGVTFPLAADRESGPLADFGAEFAALVERVQARVIDRLQEERSPDRRAAIAGFPAQLASLEAPLAEFLREAFGGSRLNPAPFLRGVYLTSATQEGTPIDRLTGMLSRAFGIDQRGQGPARPEQGRAYFLTRLLKEVIFGEAMLVASRMRRARHARMLHAAAWAGSVALVAAGAAALWHAAGIGAAQSDRFAEGLSQYEAAARGVLIDPVTEADLASLAPVLDRARALPAAAGEEEPLVLGLSQSAKLAEAGRVTYRHALERGLLPRLLWRLEAQMRGGFNRPDLLYEATRVYLMLGSAGPLDRDLVRAWMALDWAAAYPGATAAPLRETLAGHLAALLEAPLPAIELDGELIDDARRAFSRVSLAERVYSRIRLSAAATALPPWHPADAAGPSGVRLFARGDRPMTEGIPGLYTVEGFHRVVLPSLPQTVAEVAGESWVLGARTRLDPRGAGVQELERGVVALYAADYARQWDALLVDLNPVLPRTLPQAVQDLFLLGAPQSPMRDLLAGIARQLTLSRPPEAPGGAQAVQAAAQAATGNAAARLGAVLGQAAGPPPAPPGQTIDERYRALRDLVGSGPGAPLDGLLGLLTELHRQLAATAAAQAGGSFAGPAGADAAQLLLAEATRQPQPVGRWLQAIAARAQALRGGGVRQQATAAWNGGAAAAGGGGSGGAVGGGGVSPAQLCRQAVEGRFPFRPGAASDTPMDDFIRLFAPGGLFDSFFSTQLRPFVDMSGRAWRPQAVDGVPAPVSQEALTNFQRAALIRDVFFASGPQPGFRLDITPVSLDAGARQAMLDLDGITVTYAHGPTRATQVTWPGPSRMTSLRLVFDPAPSSGLGVLQAGGPWALLRLFQQGSLRPAGTPERFTLSFTAGERSITYEIRASSTLNPLAAAGLLQEFRCPAL